MKVIKSCLLVLIIFYVSAYKSYSQDSRYHFAGDLTSYQKQNKTVRFQLTNGAVKIAYLQGVGFRIRYSFSGKFSPLFSYATVDKLPPEGDISVDDQHNKVLLKGGEEVLEIQKKPFRITYQNSDRKTFMKDRFGAGHLGDKISHIVKRYDGTAYYGLGERADEINRAGKKFTLWNTDRPAYKWGNRPLYQSYPFYIGLHNGQAYGVYYDNSFKTMFDFGGQLKTSIGYYADGGELRYYIFYGPDMKDVLKKYTALTGRSPMPPKWSLGYQQSRYSYYPAQKLYDLKKEFRSRKIPMDVLYLDIDYMRGYRDFTWNNKRFPHPGKMLADLKDDGVKVVTIIDPGIKKDSTYSVYNEGLQRDAYVTYPDSTNYVGKVWPGKTTFPDFSDPSTRDWWGKLISDWQGQGVAGTWIDMNEPSVFGGKTMPYITEFDKDGRGASHYEMHNEYGLLEAKATYNGLRKAFPNQRPFVLTRAAFSGIQRYSAMWTGDNTSQWEDVKKMLTMVMSTGLAGEPFDGFDIGGFIGSPSGVLYTRFLQAGIFMPLCRTHTVAGSKSQEPWDYGPAYTFINKKLIQLRYKLLPVLYTAFYDHTQTGAPIIRPLVYEYQNDPKTYNIEDQFMVGHHLMVAPVTKKGKSSRDVYLPEGNWYGFFDHKKYQGGKKINVSAPVKPFDGDSSNASHALAGLPLFAQGGSVIPMQQVQQYVGQKNITNMNLRVYDGGSRKSKLYEDDGDSQDYRNGEYRLTEFQTYSTPQNLDLDVTMKHKKAYDGAVKTFTWHIFGITDRPESIKVDGKLVKTSFDKQHHTIRFRTLARPLQVSIKK